MTLKEVISIANPTTYYGDPVENRTPVSSVRGSCPRPLDDGAIIADIVKYQRCKFTFVFFILYCESK